jgi:hypothetical protein
MGNCCEINWEKETFGHNSLCAYLVTNQSIILRIYMHIEPVALLLVSEGLPKKICYNML